MIVLGVVLILVGWLLPIHLLLILGVILAVVGVGLLALARPVDRKPVGYRRWYW